ncbi:MAG: hypothetical protein EPO28_01625 [Saprospiraceae bacterium]|nr:MAG: hypothetical protein EPO28_01625 [Saprospiraceae bacterium]
MHTFTTTTGGFAAVKYLAAKQSFQPLKIQGTQSREGIEKRMIWHGTPKQENFNPQRTSKHGHRVL